MLSDCPGLTDRCVIDTNKEQLDSADAVVFHAADLSCFSEKGNQDEAMSAENKIMIHDDESITEEREAELLEELKKLKEDVPRKMFGVETASAGSATVQLQLSHVQHNDDNEERNEENGRDGRRSEGGVGCSAVNTSFSVGGGEDGSDVGEKGNGSGVGGCLGEAGRAISRGNARAVELAASRRTPPTSSMSALPMHPVPGKKMNQAPEEKKTPMVMKAPPPLPRTSTPNPPKIDPQQAKPSESRKRQQEVKEDVTDVIWKLLKDMKEKEKEEGETSEPPAKKKTCMLCLEPHETRSCSTFTTDMTRKQAFMMTPGRCGNCGYVGHAIAECRLEKVKCRLCKGDHLPYACLR